MLDWDLPYSEKREERIPRSKLLVGEVLAIDERYMEEDALKLNDLNRRRRRIRKRVKRVY